MPPELVDVNVHPTKLEVRFQDGSRLYSQLLGTLRTKFLSTDLTHRLEPVAPQSGAPAKDGGGTVVRPLLPCTCGAWTMDASDAKLEVDGNTTPGEVVLISETADAATQTILVRRCPTP